MFPTRGALALVTTALALVLLFNFKTPDEVVSRDAVASTGRSSSTTPGSSSSGGSSSSSGPSSSRGPSSSSGPSSSRGPSTSSTASPSGTSPTARTETLTGSIIATRYGSVEVQLTITNGSITAVSALELPSGGQSGEISSYVEPILSSEALTAQSANIDIVSGATYTSRAYAKSLQSALDQAAVSTQAAG